MRPCWEIYICISLISPWHAARSGTPVMSCQGSATAAANTECQHSTAPCPWKPSARVQEGKKAHPSFCKLFDHPEVHLKSWHLLMTKTCNSPLAFRCQKEEASVTHEFPMCNFSLSKRALPPLSPSKFPLYCSRVACLQQTQVFHENPNHAHSYYLAMTTLQRTVLEHLVT